MAVNSAVLALAAKPEYANLTDAEAATTANTASVRKTDSTLKNSRAIIQKIGVTKAQSLYTALGLAGLRLVQELLGGDGIDFSSDQTQGMIDTLVTAQAFSAEDGAALKAIGVWFVSPYTEAGGSGTATAEDFASARKLATFRAHASGRYNAAVDAIDAETVADLAALKTILGA